MTNRPVAHIEISASAPQEAAKFYSEMFGWKIETMQPFDYVTFMSGNVGGGFAPVNEGTNAGDVIVYFDSSNLEADLEKLEALGGKRVGDIHEVPGQGRYSHFIDPTGNRLALWQTVI